jgi:hypothetical protein
MALVQNLSLLALLCACVWLYYNKYPTQHTNTVHVLPPVYPPRTNTNHRRRRTKKTPTKPKSIPAKPKETPKPKPILPAKPPVKKKITHPAKPLPKPKRPPTCSDAEPPKSSRQYLTMKNSMYGCPAQTFKWNSDKGGYWDGLGHDKRILNPDGKYLVCARVRKTLSTGGYFSKFPSVHNPNLCYHTSI